jgi:DNA-binding transcriptional ArsR family regulator
VQPGRDPGRDGQAELIGHTRARILTLLERPQTTADLAARLSLSPSTVSYHLGVLYRAGLLERRRDRRRVVYTRV